MTPIETNMQEPIISHISEKVLYIELNRPEKRNSLNLSLIAALSEAFDSSEKNQAIRIVVLSGSTSAFSAGADLSYLQELQANSYSENLSDSNLLGTLLKKIYRSPKVTISLVEGPAIAGGCGLASACDFVFSTPTSTFGYPEVKIGFVPAIVTLFLVKRVGESKAKELLLTGNIINAEKAQECGLVNFISPASTIREEAARFCKKLITETSAQSIALEKEVFAALDQTFENSILTTAEINARSRMTDDFKKGLSSFLNKTIITW